ncbi:MAG: hypothetical protein WBC82_01350, partial [Dehalococcoidia bacterium]
MESSIERLLRTGNPESVGAQRCSPVPAGENKVLAPIPKTHLAGVEPMVAVQIPVGGKVQAFVKLFRDHPSNYIDSREHKTVNELDDEAV